MDMDIDEEVALLRKTPLFENVELSKLKLLAFTSERLIFQPGQVVFKQGEFGDAAYFILNGEARVTVEGPSGELELAIVRAHEIVGEIAILCDAPRIATITAANELTTLRISKDLFLSLIEEFPKVAIEVMRELARRLQSSNLQLQAIKVGRPGG
tara:strand:- start:3196 stop:3660 length:465 start_codon:yes stop_codon:yes gene_type:complete